MSLRFLLRAGVLCLIMTSVPAPGASGTDQEQVVAAAGKLESLVHEEMKATGIPGIAVAIVYRGKVIFAKGFGLREAGKPDRVDADTVFQLASLSKPIGSTVIAALVGEGAVAWDARINDLDPGFSMSEPWVTREITIRDLYAHRSGLPSHAGDQLEDLGFSRAEILRRLRFQLPSSSFRSGYAYTNFGMTEAALAAAMATGTEWETLSEQKLYHPLGMTATSSRYADFAARPNRALGHVRENEKWVQKFQRQPDAQTPAGGVSSSINDLAKWMILQLADGKFDDRQIVAREALAETHHPHMLTGFNRLSGMPTFYGLGWNVGYDPEGRLRLSHSGAFSFGAATAVYLVPAEQLGVVVLTNASPLGVAEGIASVFLDVALYGHPKQDWLPLFREAFAQMEKAETAGFADYSVPPASPAPPLAHNAYVGKYVNDLFGTIEFVAKDGGMTMSQGPKPILFPMTHWDRDTFTYVTQGESGRVTAGVAFSVGPDGKAFSVSVENLNRQGQGVFVRQDEK